MKILVAEAQLALAFSRLPGGMNMVKGIINNLDGEDLLQAFSAGVCVLCILSIKQILFLENLFALKDTCNQNQSYSYLFPYLFMLYWTNVVDIASELVCLTILFHVMNENHCVQKTAPKLQNNSCFELRVGFYLFNWNRVNKIWLWFKRF